jgi:flagellar biogenesis protein FliO
MSPFALTALLCLTQAPTPTADEGSATRVAAKPAPPSAADSVLAAAFGNHIDTPATEQKASPTTDWSSLAAPGLAIAGLGVLALTLTRRKRGFRGNIRIVESAALGPKRSLVIADVLGDRLVLGVSEAGVVVLATKAVPAEAIEPDLIRLPAAEPLPQPMSRSYPRMGFFARLLGRTPKAQQFDDVLTESIEDRELREKLASGFRGVVP